MSLTRQIKLPVAGSQYPPGVQFIRLRLVEPEAVEDLRIGLPELRATVRTGTHSPILTGLRMCAALTQSSVVCVVGTVFIASSTAARFAMRCW